LTRYYPNYFLKIKFLLENNFGIRPNSKIPAGLFLVWICVVKIKMTSTKVIGTTTLAFGIGISIGTGTGWFFFQNKLSLLICHKSQLAEKEKNTENKL